MKRLVLILAMVAAAVMVVSSCSKKKFETPDSLVGTSWTASETIPKENGQITYALSVTDQSNWKMIVSVYINGQMVDQDNVKGTYIYEKPNVIIKEDEHTYEGFIDGGTLFIKDAGEYGDLYFSRN